MKALLAATAGLALIVSAAQAATYAVIEIPLRNYAFVQASAINASGQIIGTAHNIYAYAAKKRTGPRWPVYPVTSFLYADGSLSILKGLGGVAVTASGINDSGVIVGSSSFARGYATHAVRISSGTATDLGTLGGTSSGANAINASGDIVGNSTLAGDKATHAFMWSGGAMVDLGTLGGTYASASAINASGQIAGSSNLTGDETIHAFLYSSGAMTDLGALGGGTSSANGINASGQIVGSASLPGDKATHAFLWSGGAMSDLGPAGSTYSQADAIDSAGRVVGTFSPRHGRSIHAFLFENGAVTDLNSLIDPSSGWELQEAIALNDSGLIVGTGSYGGRSSAFLLTPIDGSIPAPAVAISGPAKIVTHAPRLTIRGTAFGSVLSVTCRVRVKSGFQPASGVTRWKFAARLHPGKNIVTVVAHGPGGSSSPARVLITRL